MQKQQVVNLLGVLLFFPSLLFSQVQVFRNPLGNHPLLSGNFGELRATHFHTGIDYKTGGVEGLPVICVADGVVSRVAVSPTGYGLAVYCDHPNGLTTVYGHLSRFAPSIAEKVKAIQYKKESFAIDEKFYEYDLVFNAGDTLGYSGNSGSSGGPHLHFEVRDSWTEQPLNPLRFVKVGDREAPLIKAGYLYWFSSRGLLRGKKNLEVTRKGNEYDAGEVEVPAGLVGLGIHAEDRMNGSMNRLGVYEMTIYVDSVLIYKLKMDTLTFGQGRLVHAVKDAHLRGGSVYTGFGYYQDRLPGITSRDNGFLRLVAGSTVNVRIVLKDFYGNTSSLRYKLTGREPEAEPGEDATSYFLEHHGVQEIVCGNYRFVTGKDASFMPLLLTPAINKRISGGASGGEILTLAFPACPLPENATLYITGLFPEKSVICLVNPTDGKLTALSTQRREDGLEARTNMLGSYTVVRDTLPPVITYLGVAGNRMRFRIRDELSGIASYRVELNGQWVLFEYDPKRGLLVGSTREALFRSEKGQVKVVVSDGVGNVAEYKVDWK